eukprot:scaffold5611_cov132-Isochrysis_galbana.AAC.3
MEQRTRSARQSQSRAFSSYEPVTTKEAPPLAHSSGNGLMQHTPAPCDRMLEPALVAGLPAPAKRKSHSLNAASSPPEYRTCGLTVSKATVQPESECASQDESKAMPAMAVSATYTLPVVLLNASRSPVPAAAHPHATLIHTPAPTHSRLATAAGAGLAAASSPSPLAIPTSMLKSLARPSEQAAARMLASPATCFPDHEQSRIPVLPTVASRRSCAFSAARSAQPGLVLQTEAPVAYSSTCPSLVPSATVAPLSLS